MSVIALIGDVHANLPALDAVLAHARSQGIEAIWNIGDFVGYGAFPDEVVDRLKKLEAVSILGNYDRKVLQIAKKREKWKDKKPAEKLLAFEWTFDHLSVENRHFLISLPEERLIETQGWKILLTHGSPVSREEHLMPDTPVSRLRELADLTPAQIIVHGHSHVPYVRKVDQTWWINTGSVGRPDDGDPRACYAVIKLSPSHVDVTHFRIDYDLEAAVRAIRRYHLPENFAKMIIEGRPLDYVINEAKKDSADV